MDGTKFKLTINNKDILFDEITPPTTITYWQQIFQSLNTIELYSSHKYEIIKIGLAGSSSSSSSSVVTNDNIDTLKKTNSNTVKDPVSNSYMAYIHIYTYDVSYTILYL